VYNEAVRPLEEIQYTLNQQFEAGTSRIRAKLGIVRANINSGLSQLQKAKKGRTELTEAEKQELEESLDELHSQEEDLENRLSKVPSVWTSDFTSEALAACLKNNDERIAVLSDEGGIALYNLLGRYNNGNVTDDMLLCKCFSGNAHAVDRISRTRVSLQNPCVALLLLVQPDLLRLAFSNERLLVGGFLARCFTADTGLEMQEETEESAVHFDEVIAEGWNTFIKDLYAKFHEAREPYELSAGAGVRAKSRLFLQYDCAPS
jgi:hypothetical protein